MQLGPCTGGPRVRGRLGRTFATLAVGRQPEAGGAGAVVGPERVLARVLAQAAGRAPALVHICGAGGRCRASGRAEGAWTPAASGPGAERDPGAQKERGGRGSRGRRQRRCWTGTRGRRGETDGTAKGKKRAEPQLDRTAGSLSGPERAGHVVRARLAGGRAWGRQAPLRAAGRGPGHQSHLPTQARPKASRWKPGLQSQR